MRFRGNVAHSKITKDSRRIPVYGDPIRGDGNDYNKWYHCWNCGFLCNVDRNAIGDSQSRDGVVFKDYSQQIAGGKDTAILGDVLIAGENDAEGNPKAVKNSLMVSEDTYGCPFCGTLNWRGDY